MSILKKPLPFGRAKAGVISTLVFLALSLIISGFLFKKDVSSGLYFPLLLGIAGVSGILGGVCATKKERKNGLVNGASAAVIPIAAYLVAVTVIKGRFEPRSLLPSVVLLIGSMIAGVATANKKQNTKNKKRK